MAANQSAKKIGRLYSIAGIVVVLFIAFNMVVENLVYLRSRQVYDSNMASVEAMSRMNDTLSDVNENVLLLVAGMESNAGLNILDSIDKEFSTIDTLMQDYEALDHTEIEMRRYRQACYSIHAYERKINEVRDVLPTSGYDVSRSIYTQELAPLQTCATEMLMATVEIGTRNASDNVQRSSLQHGIAQLALMLVTIFGIVALFIAGRRAIQANLNIQQKEEELAEAGERLDNSRRKMYDAAHTNILTGMRNRYALDSYLSRLIGNAQFNLAVFDMDNFRVVNDTYGYEVGDEYLCVVSDRLNEEFGSSGELYNISGNEFCIIFKEEIGDMQAQQLAEQIRQSIGRPATVAGIVLQSPVSASLYHCLPSEGMDVNGLLMKMDSALHQAKRDGGDRLYYIQQ